MSKSATYERYMKILWTIFESILNIEWPCFFWDLIEVKDLLVFGDCISLLYDFFFYFEAIDNKLIRHKQFQYHEY